MIYGNCRLAGLMSDDETIYQRWKRNIMNCLCVTFIVEAFWNISILHVILEVIITNLADSWIWQNFFVLSRFHFKSRNM